MDKIVISTDKSEPDRHLLSLLATLFPGCEVVVFRNHLRPTHMPSKALTSVTDKNNLPRCLELARRGRPKLTQP